MDWLLSIDDDDDKAAKQGREQPIVVVGCQKIDFLENSKNSTFGTAKSDLWEPVEEIGREKVEIWGKG